MMNGTEQRPNSNISLKVIYTCGYTNASGLKNIPGAVSPELSGSFEGSQSCDMARMMAQWVLY